MLIKKLTSLFLFLGENLLSKKQIRPHNMEGEIHFTSGALGVFYQAGISKFLKEQYEMSHYEFSGISAGSWCSMFLASNITSQQMDNIIECLTEGSIDGNNFWTKGSELAKIIILNEDFDIDYSRLKIGITQLTPFPKKKYVTEFNNKEDVVDACIASSYIPILSGNIATNYKDVLSLDGAIWGEGKLVRKNAILNFSPDIWGKKYELENLLDFNASNIKKLYVEGYNDTKKNKNMLDQLFMRKQDKMSLKPKLVRIFWL